MNLLSSLRYLIALSEHRHFGRAAQACHITQPALSNALRTLEKEFEAPIVVRSRTYAGLTAEGERILASARRMLHEQELLKQDLRGSAEQPVGKLTLGAVPSALPIATRFCISLQQRYPGITPVLLALNSADIEAGLEDLTLDLGLGFAERLASQDSQLEYIPQYEERQYLIRSSHSSTTLQLMEPCSWQDATGHPLCLLTPDMHHRQIVERALKAAGVHAPPVIETNSFESALLCVSTGSVCSVVPGAVVGSALNRVGFEAAELNAPAASTQMAFFFLSRFTRTRVLLVAIGFAQTADWLAEVHKNAGRLESTPRSHALPL